uniref:Uncharacterized protein n=1 Tax=Anguilla anguilla TaxID=7936 RepID=A0A0E9VED2_ANGAN
MARWLTFLGFSENTLKLK